ncbi:MAG TPA: hypothetical protein VFC44_03230 [Candidatus Saccharimonadales bacterium]|nr:hypothetical protein [Candidatus Saccharimonadales bacterium]
MKFFKLLLAALIRFVKTWSETIAYSLIFIYGWTPSLAMGQTAPSAAIATTKSYVCVQRGPHSRVWQLNETYTSPTGMTTINRHSYTELATGLCYQKDDQWVDSVEQVNPVAGGAEAVQGAHTVRWASDANTTDGSVHLTAPDGTQFSSRVFGLSYFDSATGTNALIAPLKDSQGVIVGQNQVVYPDAFSNLKADIQDTYTLAGFEQDIILRERPPSPAKFGLNPATTRLQVFTEFFNPPDPQKTTVQANGLSDDRELRFGAMTIGQGRAFLLANQTATGRGGSVAKHWVKLDNGRVFLVEELPYSAISNSLQALPLHSSAGRISDTIKRTASLKSLLQKPSAKTNPVEPIKLAQVLPQQPGFVIDYSLVTGVTNFVFQNDSTYYISGNYNLYGSPIIEGGAVIKYTNAATAGLVLLDAQSNFVFQTYPYRPAVFTSANDDSVGESLPGSTGAPTTGSATYLSTMNTYNSNVLIDHARFSYAGTAFWSQNDRSEIFKDCQFVQCATNVALYWATNVFFGNILSVNCPVVFEGYAVNVDGENMTVDACSSFALTQTGYWDFYHGGLTNCILSDVDSSISKFAQTNTEVASSGSGIFQTVGSGNYYLAANSPYLQAGTTNIDPTLLGELQTLTTCPPMVFSNATISMPATFGPYAPRDTLPPTLGYHYDVLDYAFGGSTAAANITFTPGTAVGWFRTGSGWYHAGQGIHIDDGLQVTFNGTPEAPAQWVRANTVQEGGNANWNGGYGPGGMTGWATSFANAPTCKMRFTRCSVLGFSGQEGHFRDDNGYLLLDLGNCEIAGSFVGGYISSAIITNCLFERVGVGDVQYDSETSFIVRNCTIKGGTIANSTYFSMRYCAFDDTTNFQSGGATTDFDYNGFLNGSLRTNEFAGLNDQITNGFSWVTGPLGNYYQSNTSSLINRGDVTADQVGLYHFTVITNTVSGVEIAETNSSVDFGYHYVALGADGLPLDSNGDGIPDYLEDANGNGVVDSGEINWQVAGDLGLTVVITQPVNNSQIP